MQKCTFTVGLMPAKRLRGGYLQRLGKGGRGQKGAAPAKSKLASELLRLWSWGAMSAPLVQKLAAAAAEDGLHHPQLTKVARIGGSGKYAGNMHRDLLLVAAESAMLGDSISTIPLNLKVKQNVTREVPVQFLLPHKLFSNLFHCLHSSFVTSVLGGSEDNAQKFWAEMQNHPIVQARPQLQHPEAWSKMVPIGIHGDGVGYMARMAGGKSLDCLSWTSLLSKGSTEATTFLMFLIVKSVVKDSGVGQTWSKAWKVLNWSLDALEQGTWPLLDWNNQPFQEGSVDLQKRGTPLADGYSATLFVIRSDLEFLANHFGLNSPASNFPCALCQADRDNNSRPWTDCRSTAAWADTCWERTGWAEAHPQCHPLFRRAGSGIDLVYPDLMHCKHLGVDQLLLGGVLTWLVKHYLKGTIADNLTMVWSYIGDWCKDSSLGGLNP